MATPANLAQLQHADLTIDVAASPSDLLVVVRGDALEYLKRSRERFDVVFLDPPFRQNALPAVFRLLKGAEGTRVYVESSEPFAPGAPWQELKSARAGQVSYQLFQWRSDDQGGLPRNV